MQLIRGRRRLLEDDLAERQQEGRPPFIPASKHVLSPLSNWVRYLPLPPTSAERTCMMHPIVIAGYLKLYLNICMSLPFAL